MKTVSLLADLVTFSEGWESSGAVLKAVWIVELEVGDGVECYEDRVLRLYTLALMLQSQHEAGSRMGVEPAAVY